MKKKITCLTSLPNPGLLIHNIIKIDEGDECLSSKMVMMMMRMWVDVYVIKHGTCYGVFRLEYHVPFFLHNSDRCISN